MNESKKFKLGNGFTSIASFSYAHFVVDLACAFLLFRLDYIGAISSEKTLTYFLIYNLLAFGLEAFIGLFFSANKARVCSCLGCAILALGLGLGAYLETTVEQIGSSFSQAALGYDAIANALTNSASMRTISFWALVSCILAGVGNAFFHVGGGVDALSRNIGKYWRGGVFISTGALGLALGGSLACNADVVFWEIDLALALAVLVIWLFGKADAPSTFEGDVESQSTENETTLGYAHGSYGVGSLCLLGAALYVVFARSFIGFVTPETRLAQHHLAVVPMALACASFGGKFLGGFLADFLNAKLVGACSTLLAIPALGFCNDPRIFLLGVFFLNATTSITLVSAAQACNGRVGFAFGLTTFVLLCGYLLYNLLDWGSYSHTIYVVVGMLIVASCLLYISTRKVKIIEK